MNRLHQAIIFTNSLSMGVLIPVLNLALLQRGSSLETLPLLFAVYSTTVLCMELPSGICADLYGRKKVFLAACGFQLISFCILITAGNMVWLAAAMIFHGLGRAFSSGSLDALFIEQAIELHGEGCIAGVTSRMALLEGVGLALGSIAGGIIAGIDGTFTTNIVIRIGFTVILLLTCLLMVNEKHNKEKKVNASLVEHIKQGGRFVISSPQIGVLLIGGLFTGIILFAVETYWQPAFVQILPDKGNTWLLGLITFSGFFAVTGGNLIAERMLKKYGSWWSVYVISQFMFSVCMILLAAQKNTVGFIAFYSGTYLLLGAGNVAENALANKLTPNNMRASLLSFKSLILQIGGLSLSVFSSIAVKQLQIAGIWAVAGGLLGLFAVAAAVMTVGKERNKCSVKSIT